MDRPLTPLEIAIIHELPNTASQIAKRLNKTQPNTYRILKRLYDNKLVTKDADSVYHWPNYVPLPEIPAELKGVINPESNSSAWVKFFEAAWEGAPDKYQETDFDAMVEYVNKHLVVAARVAFYSQLIIEAQGETK